MLDCFDRQVQTASEKTRLELKKVELELMSANLREKKLQEDLREVDAQKTSDLERLLSDT